MNGRTTNTIRGIFLGLANTIASIGLPFITRTVIIYILGVEYVGLGSLFTSVLQVLSFTELGLGSALVYSMYEPIAKHDDARVRALLNFYKKSYRVIGCIIMIAGLAIFPFLDKLVDGDLPASINLHILFLIYLSNTVIGYFMFAEKTSLLLACQRDDLNSRVSLIIRVIQNVLQVIIILISKDYYLFSICIPVCTVLSNLLSAFISTKEYPQYYCEGKIDRQELKKIEKNVGGMVFQKIGNIVLTSVDTIVISAFLGLRILGIFNNYYYIITALNMFLGMICRVLIPAIGNSIACESQEKNYNDFQKFLLIYQWIVIWMSVCLLCLFQPFIKLWVGQELMLPNKIVILFVAYFFILKWLDIVHVYREASGIWWQGKMFPLISAAVNLTLDIILVKLIGLAGILLSTILCLLFIHDTIGVYILKKYYFYETMSMKKFYLRQAYIVLCFLLVGFTTYFACGLFKLDGIIQLVIRSLICVILPNILLMLLFHKFGTFDEIKRIAFNGLLRRGKKE